MFFGTSCLLFHEFVVQEWRNRITIDEMNDYITEATIIRKNQSIYLLKPPLISLFENFLYDLAFWMFFFVYIVICIYVNSISLYISLL